MNQSASLGLRGPVATADHPGKCLISYGSLPTLRCLGTPSNGSETWCFGSASESRNNCKFTVDRTVTMGLWAQHGRLRAAVKVSGGPGQEELGRAISAEEEQIVLRECAKSRSRSLATFVILAIETGARKNVIRTLHWKWVNFANACIQFGKDKTPSSAGRIIPLHKRSLETLKFWAQQFPERKPEHYVFPAERYGASGDVFGAYAYATDPTRPILAASRKLGRRPRNVRELRVLLSRLKAHGSEPDA